MAAYNYPIFLKHKLEIQDTAVWCITSGSYNSCTDYGDSFIDESSCNNDLSQWGDPTNFTCLPHFPIIITENYVGFVVTSAMAQANPGMTAGTYYLRGLDTYDVNGNCKSQYLNSSTGNCESPYYESNKTVLQNAFGSTYCTDYSSYFRCYVSGLNADANLGGTVGAYVGVSADCHVRYDGNSSCVG